MLRLLMYHLIEDRQDCRMAVAPTAFAEQMRELAEGAYTPVGEEVLLDAITGHRHPPPDSVLVTFDDGYQNTLDVALPVLARYGLPALLSVCGGYMSPEHLPRHTPHATQDFAEAAAVRGWRESGRDVAAHSFSHQRLTGLSDAMLRWQVEVDWEILTGVLGTPPRTFTYPFGARDDRVRDVVSRRYQMAMTTDSARPPDPSRPYDVSRIHVSPSWDLAAFRRALDPAAGAGRSACTGRFAERAMGGEPPHA